jgi:hypothetical protein
VKIGRGVGQGCCWSPIIFKLCSEYLTKEALEGSGDFSKGGPVIRTVNCTDDLALLVRGETVLIESRRCYGMEICMKKTKIMIISKQPSRVQIMID